MEPQMTSINTLPTDFEVIKRKLYERGSKGESTRTIVEGYKPNVVPHDAILGPADLHLNLLHVAAWTGDVDTIKDLKADPLVDPAAQTAGGFTSLHLAASRGHSDAIRELLNWLNPDATGATSFEGFTALHLAAYGGHSNSVEPLLDVHDVNAQDKVFGRSALHFAAQGGHEQVIKLLTHAPGVDVRCRDRVRDLTPFLLAAMQPRGRCRLPVVKALLDTNLEQINDKVGSLTTEGDSMKDFSSQSWRLLRTIKTDNSMEAIPRADQNDENEEDMYRKFAVPVEGHSALHLAATQNNPELVSHLVTVSGILLNEGDTDVGMTPLHCAIRTGAMDAFRALMSVDKVDVNAKLVKDGCCKRPYWLPPASAFSNVDEEDDLWFAKTIVRYDTPLHLAIRVCQAACLPEIVITFSNHPAFNPAIHNISCMHSLEVAWQRLDYCAQLPSLVGVRRRISKDPQRLRREEYQYGERIYLHEAIQLLKRHPSNTLIVNEVGEMRKAAQDSVNAFLVAATLLAGLTFRGYLQRPFGTDVGEYRSKPARLFWLFNSLAFYFAVYTILRCLLHIIRTDRLSDENSKRSFYVAIIRIQSAVPLTLSVGFGIGAFVAAGYANLPPNSRSFMLVCTVSGLLLVLSQLLWNLSAALSTLQEAIYGDDENLTRTRYIFSLLLLWGSPVSLPVIYSRKQIGKRKLRPLKERILDHMMAIAFVGFQLYGAVGVGLYAVMEVLT